MPYDHIDFDPVQSMFAMADESGQREVATVALALAILSLDRRKTMVTLVLPEGAAVFDYQHLSVPLSLFEDGELALIANPFTCHGFTGFSFTYPADLESEPRVDVGTSCPAMTFLREPVLAQSAN